ncbi:rab-GTPase-TBC domain-containing protein [Xylaria bambusicola]|uniref:rab-GTPase-TBC domain-containing protein n=1 Tax=Xylaria bambusicola TaxID=326684 RepID=UPI0020081E8E|nr:rab-GTPase-TBC domain-containing protein [Xylaria bambusicola]KAI0527781.1 rab-GTPase-TBC domain-containing protein [Xylaria bambusicola]
MRSLTDASARWQETLKHSSSLADLQRAVKHNASDSPCIVGCRSVCWKAFLLNQTTLTDSNWTHALLESRSSYTSLREHFLKYCKHPEYLNAGNSDPLADDANSPWNTYRQDEISRAEILQDVQRLPDEPFYHQPHIQTLITDVLFIYCKLNPDVGGYRQGMHELLAPIVYVVEQDAIDPADALSGAAGDLTMVEMLDASFIEHDSFALFSKVMDCAKAFYETGESADNAGNAAFGMQSTKSSIVEKSQYIHEVCLHKVDPELSAHLKNIEVLPQVFLIRWIRLLFSREFPFDQMLVLWDNLFSIDPTFKLIDLICTSMLLRIRWDLLEADYSVALQLLLKYPIPHPPNGPHTFIDDAVYLQDHLHTSGGATLITKYTRRAPNSPTLSSPPTTPRGNAPSLRQKFAGARSPLSSPRFRPPPGGVEAFFGAAKNVLEQGERLGINQAVRDAMVEIRRNVHEAKTSMKTSRDLFTEPRPNTAIRAVAVMDRRNKQLAAMLDEPIASLRAVSSSGEDALEAAIARLQFIKVYLEDSTLALPDDDQDAPSSPRQAERKVDSEPLSNAVAAMALNTPMVLDSPNPSVGETPKATTPVLDQHDTATTIPKLKPETSADKMDTDPLGVEPSNTVQTLQRPQPPIPTRSTLAQSSFSWMLEPDISSSSSSSQNPFNKPSSSSSSSSMFGPPNPGSRRDSSNPHHRKKPSASRERTAFLFGEVPSDAEGNAIREEDIFGLEPLGKKGGVRR